MKQLIFTGALLLTCSMAGEAMAACDAKNQVKNDDLPNLLSGNTMCIPNSDGWEKQEEHHSGGELWDYKMGDTNKMDPRRKLGTWSASTKGANSAVTYVYNAFGDTVTAGPFNVYSTGGNGYEFCKGGTVEASGTIIRGTNVGCSSGRGVERDRDSDRESNTRKPTGREK